MRSAAALCAPILVLACGGGGGGGGPDGDADADIDVSDLTYRPCDAADRVGEFRVALEEEFTGVQGAVADGVVPGDVPDVVETIGDCRVLAPRVLFCDPPCAGGETCDEGGSCIAYPSSHDVGTVAIAGMEAAVEMTPRAPGNFYNHTGTLPYPGFAPGAGMEMTSTGGDYAPLSLLGWGIGAIVPTMDDVLVDTGSPASVAWNVPEDPGPARVRIEVDLNRHGASSRSVECDVPDTGSFEISASLIETLLDAGLSGFPSVILSRRTADSMDIEPGCVEFLVVSEIEIAVEIPGLTSCTKDGDCPDGETCQGDLTCR